MELIPNPPPSAASPAPATPPPLPQAAPIPVLTLDYSRPAFLNEIEWFLATRCETAGEWHGIQKALTTANIVARMDAVNPEEAGQTPVNQRTFQLWVRRHDVPLAQTIIDASRAGRQWCPWCGATDVRNLTAAWYWYILAILFLGLSPIWPPAKICDNCGKKW